MNANEATIYEAKRIEEDAEHSFKGHFNASTLWSMTHYCLGIPMSITAAWAGVDAFSSEPQLSGYLALITAALAAIQTFINPSEKAERHKSAGSDYLALRNNTRIFRNVLSISLPADEMQKMLLELAGRRDELARSSPSIPRCSYLLAKRDVDAGLSQYRVDANQ